MQVHHEVRLAAGQDMAPNSDGERFRPGVASQRDGQRGYPAEGDFPTPVHARHVVFPESNEHLFRRNFLQIPMPFVYHQAAKEASCSVARRAFNGRLGARSGQANRRNRPHSSKKFMHVAPRRLIVAQKNRHHMPCSYARRVNRPPMLCSLRGACQRSLAEVSGRKSPTVWQTCGAHPQNAV